MDLELKHILPYLAYNLQYGEERKDLGSLKDVINVIGVLSIRGTIHNVSKIFEYEPYKPILTPLNVVIDNYLTIPRNEWNLLHLGSHDYDMIKSHRATMASFGSIQKLYEYHIDFQGLIDKGLAIDGTKIPNFEIKKPNFKEYYG